LTARILAIAAPCRLNHRNVDFLHLHHRIEGAFCFIAAPPDQAPSCARALVSRIRVPAVSAAAAAILSSNEFGAAREVRTLVLLPVIDTAVPPESDAVKDGR